MRKTQASAHRAEDVDANGGELSSGEIESVVKELNAASRAKLSGAADSTASLFGRGAKRNAVATGAPPY